MSHATRRKHVLKEMLDDDYALPTAIQQIVRVVSSPGNNLHEVEAADAALEKFLVSMPNKFRKNVWVKRGDYMLVEPIEEGDRVKAEICKILTPEHIREYTKAGVWPMRFDEKRQQEKSKLANVSQRCDDDSDVDDDLLPPNTNRNIVEITDDDDDDTDSSEGADH